MAPVDFIDRCTITRRLAAAAGSMAGLWLIALGLEGVAAAAAIWLAGQDGPKLVAVIVTSAASLRFGVTLLPGRVPLITHYARCDAAGLPRRAEGYTRRLTFAWAGMLALFTVLQAGTVLGAGHVGPFATAQAVACMALFIAEPFVRVRIFPDLAPASPLRTLQAIWRATAQCHAG